VEDRGLTAAFVDPAETAGESSGLAPAGRRLDYYYD
jgi:hypothetical protein